MLTNVQMTKAETLGKEWGYYKRNIEKHKKEAKQAEQREERGGGRFHGGRDDHDNHR